MSVVPVAIIGAGPAGMASGLQLKRHGVEVLIFERARVGGLLCNANLVENYPGFPQGISGRELVALMEQQVNLAGLRVTFEEVVEVRRAERLFKITTQGNEHVARVLIVATGTQAKTFREVDVPPQLAGRVYYEVFPLLHETGKRIAIVGAGDAAFDCALNLSRKNEILILNRGDETKCLPLLKQRAERSSRISYHTHIAIRQLEEGAQNGMAIHCNTPQGGRVINADYLVGAIGREARLDFISIPLRERMDGLVARGLLHVVGDVKNGHYRQTAIAVGEGIMAAMKIHNLLQEMSQ